ncbi:MAG: hypothetical protein ACLSAF_08180 [Intestinimonas sp.]
MKKKLLALTLAVSLLAGALAGCTRPQAQTTPTPAPTQHAGGHRQRPRPPERRPTCVWPC